MGRWAHKLEQAVLFPWSLKANKLTNAKERQFADDVRIIRTYRTYLVDFTTGGGRTKKTWHRPNKDLERGTLGTHQTLNAS